MILTTELLQAFVGGQVEAQNASKGYLVRGEIKAAKVVDDVHLSLDLAWLAKGVGFPPLPTGWEQEPSTSFGVNLTLYEAKNIGPGTEGSDRLCLSSDTTGFTIVLFPPDGSKLPKPEPKPLGALLDEFEALPEGGQQRVRNELLRQVEGLLSPTSLATQLERFIIHDEERGNAPAEAQAVFEAESKQGVPTAIAKHPTLGYFVIQTSGQGPYIIWPEEAKRADKDTRGA